MLKVISFISILSIQDKNLISGIIKSLVKSYKNRILESKQKPNIYAEKATWHYQYSDSSYHFWR